MYARCASPSVFTVKNNEAVDFTVKTQCRQSDAMCNYCEVSCVQSDGVLKVGAGVRLLRDSVL